MGTLKNLVIAVTGALPHENTQLKKWIEANGGRYSPNVRKGVTHLIAGRDAWKNASDAVQAANKLKAFVVSYDWLEDSLQKRRKLAETRYTWEYLWQERKRGRELKKLGALSDAKKFNDGCEEAKKATGTGTSKSRSRAVIRKPKVSKSFFFADVVNVPFVSAADDLKRRREEREATKAKKVEDAKTDRAVSSAPSLARSSTSNAENVSSLSSASSHALSMTSLQSTSPAPGPQAKKPSLKDLYHYYLDTTGFEYKIVLTRCNLRANEITRYRLSILESHTKPHVYCTFAEYFPPGGSNAGSGDGACIQALFDFNNTFHEDGAPGLYTEHDEALQTNTPQAPFPHRQQDLHAHPEATRLRSVLTPPAPSATLPYKTLVAPTNSPFATAWRAFRHAFRDLTLLSWEERFDVTKTLYKQRAAHFGIEPFVYVRPKHGLPLGLRVQEAGLFQNQTLARVDEEGKIMSAQTHKTLVENGKQEKAGGKDDHNDNDNDNDNAYTHNTSALPFLTHPLGPGIIGTALQSDTRAAAHPTRRADQIRQHASPTPSVQYGNTRPVHRTREKPDFSRPLFNGVTGRPRVDAWGRYKRAAGGEGGVVKKRALSKSFPCETGML